MCISVVTWVTLLIGWHSRCVYWDESVSDWLACKRMPAEVICPYHLNRGNTGSPGNTLATISLCLNL